MNLAPLPQAPFLGEVIYIAGIALVAVALLPVLRTVAVLRSGASWITRMLPAWLRSRRILEDPARPVSVEGLSRSMTALVRETRTLALELRERSEDAQRWPSEGEVPRSGWRTLFRDDQLADFRPLVDTRRDVWDWLGTVAQLSELERDSLRGLGVDTELVRRVLVEEGPAGHPVELVRTLAGMMWSYDERLAAAAPGVGYRAGGADHVGLSTQVPSTQVPPFTPPPSARPDLDLDRDREASEDSELEDTELTRRHRQLATVLHTHGPSISRLAASYGRTQAEREDLEQDIALALWRALPTFRGESSLATFVHRIARYRCFRALRRRVAVVVPVESAEARVALADPQTCPEAAVLHEDDRQRMLQALAKLPRTLESAISLHLRGLSYAEIAAALGITEHNVSVRLSRARQRLRRELCAA